MKEFKRIISLAMVLILCVSLLPMNQNLIKAEAQLDDSTKLKNIILRVYDGKEWTNAVYTSEFDPNNREYTINLDIKYKKVQFYFEKASNDQVIEAKDKNMCPVRDSNYTEEYSLRPQDNTFWFYVKSSNGSKVRDYVFKVKKGLEDNAHSVSATGGNRDLPKAFGGDIVKYYAVLGTGSMIFDHWLVNGNNVVLDDPYRFMGEFTMPNSEAKISAQFKDSSDDGSKLRYIIVHAMRDNVWETFYDAVKIKDDTKEYELNLMEGYTEFYLTLQTEDFTPYFENENHPEEGYLLRNSNDHIKIQANSSELKIADYYYGFITEKSILNKEENVLNFKIISKNSQNISEYTLKINNGEVKYTVTFNSNGAEGTMQAQKIKKGEKCTLPENGFTPPENKIFAGWKIGDEDKKPGDKITVNGNIDVKAIWKDIEYKVTFNSNEGTGDMDEKLVKAGEDFELPGCTFTAPEGQEFKAWSVDGKEYPAKTKIKINKETEVTAIWKAIEYKVTFNSNEGTGDMDGKLVKAGEDFELPGCTFTAPEGQEFKAWSVDGQEYPAKAKIKINKETTIKAIWKDIEYKVTFNSNEGSGDMDEKLVKAGEEFELPDCSFTAPDGQEFKAWSVEGQEYPAKAKLKINKETEVKAIWKDKTTEKFTVTFNSNGAEGTMQSQEIKKGEDFELPANEFTAPDGQEFKAWEVDGEEYQAKAKIKINKETTIKAIWKAKTIAPKPEDENKKYEIKLTQASNGTIIINPTEANEGELVTVQAVPDYGYELESIIILDENQNSVPMIENQFKMPKGGVSIYAKFKELAPAIYPEIDEEKPIENKRHRRDWRYDRYDEDKNTNEEEKSKSEKEIKSDESKTIITIGSQTLEKVMNGVRTVKNMDSAPYIKRGRTMLPLRYLAEALGYKVFWLNETRTVVIVDLGLRVEIPVDTNLIIVNGIKYTSDLKPEIVHHRTMLPIANIARALGLKDGEDIIWDDVNRQVTINKKSNK